MILKVLSGEHQENQREGTEWYKQWEAWAKEQWDNAQREANRAHEEFQRQQQQQRGQPTIINISSHNDNRRREEDNTNKHRRTTIINGTLMLMIHGRF